MPDVICIAQRTHLKPMQELVRYLTEAGVALANTGTESADPYWSKDRSEAFVFPVVPDARAAEYAWLKRFGFDRTDSDGWTIEIRAA